MTVTTNTSAGGSPAVPPEDLVTVTIDGPDEETAAPVIETFFKENF